MVRGLCFGFGFSSRSCFGCLITERFLYTKLLSNLVENGKGN